MELPDPKLLEKWTNQAEAAMDGDSITGCLPIYGRDAYQTWGIAIANEKEAVFAGNLNTPFTLMSVVKPFLLLYLIELHGPEFVFSIVGHKPSDLPFYSVAQLHADGGWPRNPMLNSGAMVLADHIPGPNPTARLANFLGWLNPMAGAEFALDQSVYNYCLSTEDSENLTLAKDLEAWRLTPDWRRMFETYFQLCCLSGTLVEVASAGRIFTFENNYLKKWHQDITLKVIADCGLYEQSGAWFGETEIPAKSGVSGVVLGILPGQACIAAFSPLLNAGGNPVLPLALVKTVGRELRRK